MLSEDLLFTVIVREMAARVTGDATGLISVEICRRLILNLLTAAPVVVLVVVIISTVF